MKRILFALILSCFVLTPITAQTPGVRQILVRIVEGYTIRLKFYSTPPISTSFSSRNTRVATVDPKTGVIKGISSGNTWVIGKYYDGKCIKSDSTRVVVLPRP